MIFAASTDVTLSAYTIQAVDDYCMTQFNWLQPVVTLAATFVGAYLAYWLTNVRELRKRTDDQLMACNRSILALLDMYNSLECYRQDVAAFNGPEPWLNAPVSLADNWGRMRIAPEGLIFLLGVKGQANLLPQLLLADSNFDGLKDLIKNRNQLMLNKFHPNLKLGSMLTEQDLVTATSSDAVHQAKIMWAGIIKLLEEQLKSLPELAGNLRDAAKAAHPRKPVAGVNFLRGGLPWPEK
jgi:hypothetical protein